MELYVNNLTKYYGTKIGIENITLKINSGEIVALLGANGAGKTTLIKCLMKLLDVNKGTISLDNRDILKKGAKEYKVSYIPDTPVYFEQLTVLENLQFICSAYKQSEEKIPPLLKRLELMDFLDVFPYMLSKGNKQKLMIAAALLREFDILIADEPFTALDPIQIKTLKDIFMEQKKLGKIILISIHSLDLAETFCDYYIIMNKGNILVEGTLDQLLDEKQQINTMEDLYIDLFANLEKSLGESL